MSEIIVDSFAGGGGASTGIEWALGRSPDIAINHDAAAIAMHAANHPDTIHLDSNIWDVSPTAVCAGRPVGLLWASPDCKHFSKAKGGKPLDRNIRDLAWVVVRWAEEVKPRIIILENVEEFRTWGPIYEDGAPIPQLRGQTFDDWIKRLRKLGYKVEWKELRACDYGAPTIRKRLFVIARRDGQPIEWPVPTHGAPHNPAVVSGKLKPWRTAAEIINWSLPCPSIFETGEEIFARFGVRAKRPLADATMARIAKGVKRYVIDAARPFIVPVTHPGDRRVYSIDEPTRTITGAHRGEAALVTPFIAYGQQGGAIRSAEDPLQTVTASVKDTNAVISPFVTKFNTGSTGHAVDEPLHTITAAHSETHPGGASPLGVVAPFLVPRYGERPGQEPRTRPVDQPAPVIVPDGNGGSLVAAHMIRQFGASVGSPVDDPVGTITAGGGGKAGVVAAFMAQHNTERSGEPKAGRPTTEPLSTVTGGGAQQTVVAAHMLNLRGSDRRDGPIDEPAPTFSAQGNHASAVSAFMVKYYGNETEGHAADGPLGTVTTRDRAGLVTVTLAGEPYVIVDIGMRMLTARERFLAQGFAPDYVIDLQHNGKPLSGEAQGRLVGNSVCPPLAEALVAANCSDLAVTREAAE